MKEYTLKRDNDVILLTGMFDTEQKAWNIMCVRTAQIVKKEDWLFLYNENNKIVYADKAFEVWRNKRDLIEYELDIAPGIYNIKESFSGGISKEEVWNIMRERAVKDGKSSALIAKLKLNGDVLITNHLCVVFPTKIKEEVKTVDLLFEITKIKI